MATIRIKADGWTKVNQRLSVFTHSGKIIKGKVEVPDSIGTVCRITVYPYFDNKLCSGMSRAVYHKRDRQNAIRWMPQKG